MRTINLLILLLLAIAVNVNSQTGMDQKNTIGVYITPNYWPVENGFKRSFSFGIDYSRRLSAHWSLGGSIEEMGFISKNKMFAGPCEDENGLHVNVTSKSRNTLSFDSGILSIPVQLKYNFKNHIFFNTGPSLDVFYSEYNNEAGLGWRLGAGYEHVFKNGIALSLNPYLKWSSILVDFGNESSYFFFGASIGVGYKF
jgi:hypothetical protein